MFISKFLSLLKYSSYSVLIHFYIYVYDKKLFFIIEKIFHSNLVRLFRKFSHVKSIPLSNTGIKYTWKFPFARASFPLRWARIFLGSSQASNIEHRHLNFFICFDHLFSLPLTHSFYYQPRLNKTRVSCPS